MQLAVFDLDHTLLQSDSDHGWNAFLVDIGVVTDAEFAESNERWYREYTNGTLNIVEYNRWAFRLHSQYGTEQVTQWRDQYVRERAPGMIAPKTPEVLAWHRDQGHQILVITATSEFLAGPIIELMGITDYLGLKNEVVDGQYTGELIGTPTFQAGKVKALAEWRAQQTQDFDQVWFYSDSHNDLPLLENADVPVAVDADEKLTAIAQDRGWKIMSFRD